jgi:hypothetical protein
MDKATNHRDDARHNDQRSWPSVRMHRSDIAETVATARDVPATMVVIGAHQSIMPTIRRQAALKPAMMDVMDVLSNDINAVTV